MPIEIENQIENWNQNLNCKSESTSDIGLQISDIESKIKIENL